MTQISWRAFGEEAFADAQTKNKPVLLSVTASWCQFCRNMDEQTYGNEAIIQYINEHFVPVRVDSEQRPEINTRYAMGGLPSTGVLTPGGDVVWGGTFLPPDGMAQLLPQVLNSFHNDKENLSQHLAQQREQMQRQSQGPALNPALQVTGEITRVALLALKHHFDFAFGGFGASNFNRFERQTQNCRHRADADGNSFLHIRSAFSHGFHRIGKTHRACRYQSRILAQTMSGDKIRYRKIFAFHRAKRRNRSCQNCGLRVRR